MFTTNLEDGREAPSKARKKGAKRLEFLVSIYFLIYFPKDEFFGDDFTTPYKTFFK